MPRNYNERLLVAVELKIKSAVIQYGFRSAMKIDTDRATLGQVELAALPTATGLVIGCNSPKPAKATKKAEETNNNVTSFAGSKSGFVATDNIDDAKIDGWLIKGALEPRNPLGASYVTINGVKYGWNPQKLPSGVTAPTGDTGVQTGTANDVLCFGCQFPKPPRMKRTFGLGNSYSTFADTNKVDDLLAAGWDRAGKSNTSLAIINTNPPASDPG